LDPWPLDEGLGPKSGKWRLNWIFFGIFTLLRVAMESTPNEGIFYIIPQYHAQQLNIVE
jgi:hypothetical protein